MAFSSCVQFSLQKLISCGFTRGGGGGWGGAWVLPVDGLMDKGRVKTFLQPYAKYKSQRIELYSVWFVQGNEFLKSTFEMHFFLGRHQLTSIK